MKKQFRILGLMIVILFSVSTTKSYSADKVKIRHLGIVKYLHDHDLPSEFDNGSFGLAFATMSYHVNMYDPVSIGYFTGSGIQLIPPPDFDFSPMEGVFLSPTIGLDIIEAGLAVSTNIGNSLQLISHLGAVLHTSMGIMTYSEADLNYEVFGYGILPEIGTRLFLTENLNFGLSFRSGKMKNYSFVNFEKTGDPVSSKERTMFLNIAISTNL